MNRIGATPAGRKLLGASIASWPDPVSLKRQIGSFLSVFRETHERFAAEFEDAAREAIPEIVAAHVASLALSEQTRAMDALPLSREARRQFLASAYGTISESIWRRLCSLLVYCLLRLNGAPKPFEEVSKWIAFGEKYNTLLTQGDPRFAAAVIGVETVLRNADAHGTLDIAAEKIRLVSRSSGTDGTEGRQRRERSEELTDDEFSSRVTRLLGTCVALSHAAQIIYLEQAASFGQDLENTDRPLRYRLEQVKWVLGLLYLSKCDVQANGNELFISCAVSESAEPREPLAYLGVIAVLAPLLPEIDWFDLSIRHADDEYCAFRSGTTPFHEYRQAASAAQEIALLQVINLVDWRAPSTELLSPDARYRMRLLRPLAGFLGRDIASIDQERRSERQAIEPYRKLVADVTTRVGATRRLLARTPVPAGASCATANRLLDVLRDTELALRVERKAVEAGELPPEKNLLLVRAAALLSSLLKDLA